VVERLILAMRRDKELDDGGLHRFSGYLDVVGTPALAGRYSFSNQTYREAVKHLIVWAREHTEAQLFMLRLEQKPEPVAVQLEPRLAELLRKDPVAFMQMMDPTMGRPQRLNISMSAKVRDDVAIKPHPIPAGHDTLAESFGEELYIRKRGDLYECPIYGRWVPAGQIGVWTVGVNDRWASVSVENLLHSVDPPATRFFFPRAWNKDGPWISREDLQRKYDEFIKEREQCSRTHKVDT
jgi:hypothetical protein